MDSVMVNTTSSTYPSYTYYISSSTWTDAVLKPLKSADIIEFTIKDGSTHQLKIKEYLMFIVIHHDIPDNCNNEAEYLQKIMVLKL